MDYEGKVGPWSFCAPNLLKDHGWEKDHARTKFHNMLPQRKARGNAWTHTDLEGGKNDSAIRQ